MHILKRGSLLKGNLCLNLFPPSFLNHQLVNELGSGLANDFLEEEANLKARDINILKGNHIRSYRHYLIVGVRNST